LGERQRLASFELSAAKSEDGICLIVGSTSSELFQSPLIRIGLDKRVFYTNLIWYLRRLWDSEAVLPFQGTLCSRSVALESITCIDVFILELLLYCTDQRF